MAGKNWDLEFNPVGDDRIIPYAQHPEPGARVRLTPTESRRDRRYAHVSQEDGTPIGLVLKSSLMRVSKKAGGNPAPEATDRTLAVFRDRRERG